MQRLNNWGQEMCGSFAVTFYNIFFQSVWFQRDSTYSTTSTNEYNGDDDENFPDDLQVSNFNRNQKQYSTFPPPTLSRLKHRATLPTMSVDVYSDRCSHSDTSEYQSEEGFEGYGESFSEDTTLEDSPTLRREHQVAERIIRG